MIGRILADFDLVNHIKEDKKSSENVIQSLDTYSDQKESNSNVSIIFSPHNQNQENGQIMCISCNSTFDKIENLQVHIKSTHAEKKLSEESIQTDTTDLYKKESYSIIEPFIRKLDEGYMPFICILCNAPFNKIENCRNHVKRVHKDMKLEKIGTFYS